MLHNKNRHIILTIARDILQYNPIENAAPLNEFLHCLQKCFQLDRAFLLTTNL